MSGVRTPLKADDIARTRDRLATLIRVFIAGQTEEADAVEAALAPLSLEAALAAGLIEVYGDGLHAGLDLDVYGPGSATDWWVLSDLDADARPGPLRTDVERGFLVPIELIP